MDLCFEQWSYQPLFNSFSEDLTPELQAEFSILNSDKFLYPPIQDLLISRGLSPELIQYLFLQKEKNPILHDPYKLKDMDKAVNRIHQALLNEEAILIYGDYDVDGMTSVALLYKTLSLLGVKNLYTLIPDRLEDGYDLGIRAINQAIEKNISLLITVDCGISAHNFITILKEKGIDTIITDHHQLSVDTIPLDAVAVLNPWQQDDFYPNKYLAGVGVIAKLASCFLSDAQERFSDLICLGLLADRMPLTLENQSLISLGIQKLQKFSGNLGIRVLSDKIDLHLPSATLLDLSFQLVPYFNASGRVASSEEGLRLLLTDDFTEAIMLSNQLIKLNEERRKIETQVYERAIHRIQNDLAILKKPVLFLYDERFHLGVTGIVASKLSKKFGKPTILVGKTLQGDILSGSARVSYEFPLYELIQNCSSYLIRFGGHKKACGFNVKSDDLYEFEAFLQGEAIRLKLTEFNLSCLEKKYDLELRPYCLSLNFARALNLLEPYGEGFSEPYFLLRNVKLVNTQPLNISSKHLKSYLSFDGLRGFSALAFHSSEKRFIYESGDTLDLLLKVSLINKGTTKQCLHLVIDTMRYSRNHKQKSPNLLSECSNEDCLVLVEAVFYFLVALVSKEGSYLSVNDITSFFFPKVLRNSCFQDLYFKKSCILPSPSLFCFVLDILKSQDLINYIMLDEDHLFLVLKHRELKSLDREGIFYGLVSRRKSEDHE